MEKKQNSQQNKPDRTEKICPFNFNSDLKCENCRLYVQIPGFKGEFECALILAAIR